MASWIIHLRVAQQLYEALHMTHVEEFVLGNIAPDSGIPKEDGSGVEPDVAISHFRTLDEFGIKQIHIDQFRNQYMTKERCTSYSKQELAFFLGYDVHLLTDQIWTRDIVYPAMQQFSKLFQSNQAEFWKIVKKDWYDLDFMYLKEHPSFEAFQIYKHNKHIKNTYLDFFSEDAFEKRREYILDFYAKGTESIVEHDTYISIHELDQFIDQAVTEILKNIEWVYAYIRKGDFYGNKKSNRSRS